MGMTLMTLLVSGCKEKSDPAGSDTETKFVRGELAELEQALARRDEIKVLVGCMSVMTGFDRMPGDVRAEIAQRCFTEAPRLLLENAVADAREQAGKNPDMPEMNCMQLLAEDAFRLMREHPTDDPRLESLAAEYTTLCPDQVAKFGRTAGK